MDIWQEIQQMGKSRKDFFEKVIEVKNSGQLGEGESVVNAALIALDEETNKPPLFDQRVLDAFFANPNKEAVSSTIEGFKFNSTPI